MTSGTFFLALALLVVAPLGLAACADGDARMAGKVFGVAVMLSVWLGRDLYACWRKRRGRA